MASYFREFILEESASELNPCLFITLNKGRFQLCTENAIYSYDDKYDNFRLAFDKLDLENTNIKNVLVLGLGLASIPYILEKIFNLDLDYAGVEIDEEVVRLCSKYSLPRLRSNIEIFITDALSFLLTNRDKYDMICVDVFDSDKIPDDVKSISFLNLCKERLSSNGIILMNHLDHTEVDRKENESYFKTVFEPTFEKSSYMSIKGNCMMVNDRSHLK